MPDAPDLIRGPASRRPLDSGFRRNDTVKIIVRLLIRLCMVQVFSDRLDNADLLAREVHFRKGRSFLSGKTIGEASPYVKGILVRQSVPAVAAGMASRCHPYPFSWTVADGVFTVGGAPSTAVRIEDVVSLGEPPSGQGHAPAAFRKGIISSRWH